MRNLMKVVGIGFLAFAGCVGEIDRDGATPSPAGLTIDVHDEGRLAGAFRADGAVIRFDAGAVGEDGAELRFEINGKVLRYEGEAITEAHEGWFAVDAGVWFDAREIAGAQAALDALVAELGEDTTAMRLFEASVPKMAYLVANAEPGVIVDGFQRREIMFDDPRPRSLNDDNVMCIRKNFAYTASYDGRGPSYPVWTPTVTANSNWGTAACAPGHTCTTTCGGGNYSCMGRCGAGCTGFGGGWTQDCLEHDTCSHNYCASGGSSHADCGDEYNHSSSDIFSSCSGN